MNEEDYLRDFPRRFVEGLVTFFSEELLSAEDDALTTRGEAIDLSVKSPVKRRVNVERTSSGTILPLAI